MGLAYVFQYPGHSSNKLDDSSFCTVVLRIRLVRHDGSNTSRGNDSTSWDLVLAHEMDR